MKRVTSWLLAAALAVTLAVPMAGAAYSDVPAQSALAAEVQKAVDYGLMNGYDAATFGYGDSMTRAQFAAVLVRMMGWTTETPAAPTFADVPASHSWYGAVETAAANDVVDGGGAFRPGDAVTRGEMAEMLVRALGLKGAAALAAKETSLPFTDVTARKGYISVAYAIGMTKGTSAVTFAPNATATRSQAAAMLVRIYEKRRQETDWVHGFYAISSRSQIDLTGRMDAVSVGWSRMTWDGTTALLSTTSANGNEYCIPSGYADAVNTIQANGAALSLSVFMDASGGVKELLASPQGRAQAVGQIVNELTISYNTLGRNPYSGVTIDFEGLRSAQKADFNAFLTDLSGEVRALGKTLYVCVPPVLTTGPYYDGYDYRAIGSLADKVILMAYDYETRDLSAYVGTEYHKTAAPAPLDQVYMSLAAVADPNTGVQDRSKVILGFNCKAVAWQVDESGKLLSGTPAYPNNDTVFQRLAQADTVTGRSASYQTPYATYTTESGASYFLWYEDGVSTEAKMDVAKLFGVTGASIWRLGSSNSAWNWQNLLHNS